jgi:hypothetical protein
MQRRTRRWAVGAIWAFVAAVLVPALAVAAGPVRIAVGQPANDTQLSVLTPAEAAFMQKKLAMAAAVGTVGPGNANAAGTVVLAPCELDPCEDVGPPPWPPVAGPPAAKTLGTKARQQNNYYFCGPATGQVVINWSRGIINGNNDGEDPTTNWRRQSRIAEWMRTTTSGTSGANLAIGLNNPNAVLKPTPDWVYAYADNGSVQELYDKIVTDIAGFNMPLVIATAPHISGAGSNFLESWPYVVNGARHWIVIRGYDGVWGGSTPILIKYQDSSAGYGGSTGAFDDTVQVMWQVSRWNLGGHVVW